MNWDSIKRKIYFKDGSLRDIYVLDTNIVDWERWVNFINQNYSIEFYDRRFKDPSPLIDFNKVKEYWNKENEEGVYAVINVSGIKLMCYFNWKNDIENDFSPNSIKNIQDHNNLINFLIGISNILNKSVRITNEMKEEEVLVHIFHDEIIIT